MSNNQSAARKISSPPNATADGWSRGRRESSGIGLTPAAAAASNNPFASLAAPPPGSRDLGAATKLYEVPRELIEIARARANERGPMGVLTPLAPRPGTELEASVLAYTGAVVSAAGDRRVTSDIAPASKAPRSLRPAAQEAAFAAEARPSRARQLAVSAAPNFRAGTTSRSGLLYVGLVLVLGYCAHLLGSL